MNKIEEESIKMGRGAPREVGLDFQGQEAWLKDTKSLQSWTF